MKIDSVDRELKKIIKRTIRIDILDNDVEKLLDNIECDLMNDLGLDSLLMVQLIVEVENVFEIEFELDELDVNILRKYQKLRKYILKKTK